MVTLPKEFTDRMEKLLGEEYPAFLKSYEETRKYGLRINTLKISPEEFEEISDFELTPIGWIPGAYYYTKEDGAARHPFYHAGLYYLQEPSAMTPASVLPVRPGDRVLDLCAAPGGKATALGARLRGEGLLVANDLSASRCKALLKNIEVFGIPNALVTNEPPAKLAERFDEFFDAILVDAPCSGEGMFRKDDATIRAWYPEKSDECAKIQKEILLSAVRMLRPGGKLLYSTCTFAPAEDEEVIAYLLKECPEMHLIDVPEREGFSKGLFGMDQCVRLWPHISGGEGHFLALLEKDGDGAFGEMDAARVSAPMEHVTRDIPEDAETSLPRKMKRKERRAEEKAKKGARKASRDKDGALGSSIRERTLAVERFLAQSGIRLPQGKIDIRGEVAYHIPSALPGTLGGITFLRAGLLLGQFRNGRFEPSQSLAMAADPQAACLFSLPAGDERLVRYLHGETIRLNEGEEAPDGWILVAADGYPLGWAKHTGNILKNKYLAGWRSKY